MQLYISLLKEDSFVFVGGVLLAVVLLVGLMVGFAYRHRQIIKSKNKSLARNIDEMMMLKEELNDLRKKIHVAPSETPVDQPGEQTESRQIFEELNHTLLDGQRYLDPSLSRDDLVRLTHTDKTRLAQIIQDNTGGNLKEYINGLRLEHAVRLMKEHPEYTLDTVASESGFANRSTFFLAFRKKNGMTPSQYKNENS